MEQTQPVLPNLQQFRRDEEARKIATITESLKDSSNIGWITESLFINEFLPYFCGEREIALNPNFYAQWTTYAGSFTSPVNVVSDHDTTNVLFKVPGRVSTNFLQLEKHDKSRTFASIVNTTLSMSENTSAAKAGGYFQEQSVNKMDSAISNDILLEEHNKNKDMWNVIFTRYNKPLIKGKTNDINKSETLSASQSDGELTNSDFVYD